MSHQDARPATSSVGPSRPRSASAPALTALVIGPSAAQVWDAPEVPRAAIVTRDAGAAEGSAATRTVLPLPEALDLAARLEAEQRPRWAWWSADGAARHLVAAGIRPARAWDVAEVHRLLAGGWAATPDLAWALAHGLDPDSRPAPPAGGLLDALAVDAGADPDSATHPPTAGATVGHLRPDAVAGTWQVTDRRLSAWADALLDCAAAQYRLATATHPRIAATALSESAAAVLCEELRADGLPVDRPALLRIVEPLSGPPDQRDAAVLSLVPGLEHTDLRHPAGVKAMLRSVGLDVPNTRKYVLETFRDVHPVVPALLQWRKAERIATTYGLRWIEQNIGADDRLRGEWRVCDGAAGRMTAEAGLHNLPAMLRPAVRADEGHVFVRADLGQIEPRVLAVVSGDRGLAEATQDDDLYAPVAARLGVERPVAKVAVLAAMYGQRSGSAGRALEGLERAYPVAMGLLDRAYDAGRLGREIRTFGGRLIPTSRFLAEHPVGTEPTLDAARGRFVRNAVIQGAAAEFFKAWAATVRATTRALGARIVLCLHDELLVHVPIERAEDAAAAVDAVLADAARRWSGGAPVRFVADTSVIERWSDAKD